MIVTAGNGSWIRNRDASGAVVSKQRDLRPKKVLQVFPESDQVLVEGVNVRKKHLKPTQANPRGGVISKEMPIHISNVSPVADGKPTRVRFESREDGSKIRVAARTGEQLGAELRKARK
ncbi:50S ribosomal protein L24 [Mucisphaera calidilacus]|uniref:Large ribosomal subunit protein uL24 n=1 Tax=Mucisphaera calidilacus TaxID=2527982 RepID=A0A518BXR1_9BACT|nr:50S ribosomal protein L24 [Mucisphaera calidilacus]